MQMLAHQIRTFQNTRGYWCQISWWSTPWTPRMSQSCAEITETYMCLLGEPSSTGQKEYILITVWFQKCRWCFYMFIWIWRLKPLERSPWKQHHCLFILMSYGPFRQNVLCTAPAARFSVCAVPEVLPAGSGPNVALRFARCSTKPPWHRAGVHCHVLSEGPISLVHVHRYYCKLCFFLFSSQKKKILSTPGPQE